MTPFAREHLHTKRFEGGLAMAWPVAILAVLSVVGGWLQVPWGWDLVNQWLEPVAHSAEEATGLTFTLSVVASLALAVAGIWLAWLWYGRPSTVPERTRTRWPWAARTLEHKFYFDEAYDLAFYEPASRSATFLTRYVEQPLFLSSLGELGASVRAASRRLSSLQTGYVREYALALAAGLAVLAIVFIVVT